MKKQKREHKFCYEWPADLGQALLPNSCQQPKEGVGSDGADQPARHVGQSGYEYESEQDRLPSEGVGWRTSDEGADQQTNHVKSVA